MTLHSIGHSIFLTTKRISSRLAQILSTDYTKTDYSKEKKNPLLTSLARGFKPRNFVLPMQIPHSWLLLHADSANGSRRLPWNTVRICAHSCLWWMLSFSCHVPYLPLLTWFFSLYFLHFQIVTFTFNNTNDSELTECSTASRHRSTLRLMLPKDSLIAAYASLYLLCL